MEEMLALELLLELERILALEDFLLKMIYMNIITTESATTTNAAGIVTPNSNESSTVAIYI